MTYRFYEIPMATILVGKNKKPFYIHLDLLCDASSVFKAAFSEGFKEGSEKVVQLPDGNESTFELFVEWLYYRRYEMLPEVKRDDADDEGDNEERYLQIFRLFMLADKCRVFKLKNLIIETLFAEAGVCYWTPSNCSISYAYEHTTQDSGLRKLLADWFAWNSELVWYEKPDNQAFLRQQPDFATDLNISFAKNLQRGHTKSYSPFKT